MGSGLVEEVALTATPLSEVDLPLLTNNLLESFVFLCQSLPAEKENGAVLYLYPIDIDCLVLDNRALETLLLPELDDNLISYG